MSTFPLNSKAWLIDGYSIKPINYIDVSENSSGSSRQRRTVSCDDILITCSMILNNSEFSQFTDFFYDTVKTGEEFTGPYYDGSGEQRTGTMEFVGGSYQAVHLTPQQQRVTVDIRVKDRTQQYESDISDLLDGTISFEEYKANVT